MKPYRRKFLLAVGLLLVIAASFMIFMPIQSKAQQEVVGNVYSKVTLYSNDGKVLGTWTAEGLGQMDGNSYTFTVYRGATASHLRQVRISGTFTVEQTAP